MFYSLIFRSKTINFKTKLITFWKYTHIKFFIHMDLLNLAAFYLFCFVFSCLHTCNVLILLYWTIIACYCNGWSLDSFRNGPYTRAVIERGWTMQTGPPGKHDSAVPSINSLISRKWRITISWMEVIPTGPISSSVKKV